MKIKGKKIEGPNVEVVIIPRGEGDDIIFKAEAVLDMSQFEQLCPTPTAPLKMIQGGAKVPDFEDKEFQKALNEYSKKRTEYMFIKSLSATEGLEWEIINPIDPLTWGLLEEEFVKAGLSQIEISRIMNGVITANCLNEDRLEEARQRFLAGQRAALENLSSLQDEQKITQSGVRVSDSE